MRNSSGRDLSAQYALEQPARFRRDQAQPEIAPAQRGSRAGTRAGAPAAPDLNHQ